MHWLLLLCATLCYCSQWPVGVVQPEDAVMKCITSASQSWAWLATPPHNPPHSSYKPLTHFSQPSTLLSQIYHTLLLQTSHTLLITLHTHLPSYKPLTHSSLFLQTSHPLLSQIYHTLLLQTSHTLFSQTFHTLLSKIFHTLLVYHLLPYT